MRFAPTDDQIALRDGIAELLAGESGPTQVREAWENESGRLPALWSQLADMGVLAAQLPESLGGLGLNEIDLALIGIEAGRVALTEPLLATAGVAAPLFAELDTDTGRAWAERVAGGASIAVGLVDGDPVVHAATCDATILCRDGELHLIERGALSLTPTTSVDRSRRLAFVDWQPSAETLLTNDPALVDRTRQRSEVLGAAQLLGLSATMVAMTVDYVSERKQFGVPIGSFQAVKHHLANAELARSFAQPVVLRAAYSLATGDPDTDLHAAMAKAAASDAATKVGKMALQCHGGIGYTVECDLHLYLKRAWALAAADGDAAHHRVKVAAAVLG